MKIYLKKVEYLLLYLIFFTSSIVVLQVAGRPLFLWLQIICVTLLFLRIHYFKLYKIKIIPVIYLSIALSTASSIINPMPMPNKKSALYWLAVWTIMLIIVNNIYGEFRIGNGRCITNVIIKAFKTMSVIQLCWIPIQFVVYYFANVDLNDFIFVKTLKCVDNATFTRNWVWYPSGFTWHSAILAPMFVLDFLLFPNSELRILVIIDSLICGNSTAIVGVVLTAIIIFAHWIVYKRRIKITTKKIIIFTFVAIPMLYLAIRYNLVENMSLQFNYLMNRLNKSSRDASTNAHLQYYQDYFKIVSKSTLPEILFGYGEGNSGYMISQIYGRYSDLKSWSIECDIVDKFVSRGIFGGIIFYYFLFIVAKKGSKINYKYAVAIIALFIQGFGYNVQCDYVFLMELIMYITTIFHIDFFEIRDKNYTLKTE